jgi:transketolase
VDANLKKEPAAEEKRMVQQQWEKENPELNATLKQFLSGEPPEIDYAGISQKPNIASRAASGNRTWHFASAIKNLIVASADLANSDKTDGFLKESKAFARGDFSGAFLQAGVSN